MLMAILVGVAGWLPGHAGAVADGVVATRPVAFEAGSLVEGLERMRARVLEASRAADREYVGGVLRTPERRFRFTLGRAAPGQDTVTFTVLRPVRTELVGFWHTHGSAGPARELFSPDDADVVRETGLPFYLIAPSGTIRVLRPEDVRRRRLLRIRDGARVYTAPLGAARGDELAAMPRERAAS